MHSIRANVGSSVPISVRHVDRGAWLSVNGTRELGVSTLWQFTDSEFCECNVTDFLAEGFAEIGVDGDSVEARLAGRCIQCGSEEITPWLTLGRVIGAADREFYPVDQDAVQDLSSMKKRHE
ncbi:hypothetical protein [Haloarcula nitratireducens]|uniref:DUF8134 domain-containing protein n=1 Tax=Haloarcula nitratireducens TaxID=2487749 RepID=A0AAW4PFU4_9EURY|nr:hypothetical protein [Halomicroarcula nitratireducens]MBX0296779.1 hypothetical protein [Halomicroarcula nitratireducens]